MPKPLTVRVPATSANLGPGFDCLGVALGRYNSFHFAPAESLLISATGVGCAQLDCSDQNLAYRSFAHCFKERGYPVPAVHLAIETGVPLARGLGSSSTAIVGGVMAAYAWMDEPWTKTDLLSTVVHLEGHPDNVVPALLGGCQLSLIKAETVTTVAIPWPLALTPVVVIPEFMLSTAEARAILPPLVSRADALFNSTRLGLLLLALERGYFDLLPLALQDRLHQPYRAQLIPGMDQLAQVAQAQGAYGLVISGAGPTLLTLCPPDRAEVIRQALVQAWQDQGISAEAMILPVDPVGAVVQFP